MGRFIMGPESQQSMGTVFLSLSAGNTHNTLSAHTCTLSAPESSLFTKLLCMYIGLVDECTYLLHTDGTGFHFHLHMYVAGKNLVPLFPAHCCGRWNWVPLFPACQYMAEYLA